MTTPRTPNPEPYQTKPRAAEERERAAGAARTTRVLAALALVLGALALGLTVWRMASPATAAAGCQTAAWDVTPDPGDLPTGWSLSASQYDIDRKTMSLLGPVPQDDTATQAVVYSTITCFDTAAADAVTRSASAATDAGQTVTNRDDLGEQGFSAIDDSGADFVQFRHGDIVVYLAASGDATPTEVDEVASAFDIALGGDGGAISAATPDTGSAQPSDEGASDAGASGAADSPAAPELVAALPTKVGSVTLSSDSAAGSSILSDDQGSRAILAALRAAGKSPDSLRVAQAFDEAGDSDLSILVLSVDGMPVEQTKALVMDSWLAASGAGVTRDSVTLDNKSWTRIDYGDQGTKDYVLADGSKVIVITTADPALAAQAAAALP